MTRRSEVVLSICSIANESLAHIEDRHVWVLLSCGEEITY